IVFRHVLHEDIARGNPFDEKCADVADHRSEPVFLFKRVCGSNRHGFLAKAAVEPADDFVLAKQLDHGVFDGAVEAHVVVEVEILLSSQLLGAVCAVRSVSCFCHSVLRFKTSQRLGSFSSYYAGTAARSASSNCSDNCRTPATFISSPSTS